jgi:hypothetical protein
MICASESQVFMNNKKNPLQAAGIKYDRGDWQNQDMLCRRYSVIVI